MPDPLSRPLMVTLYINLSETQPDISRQEAEGGGSASCPWSVKRGYAADLTNLS